MNLLLVFPPGASPTYVPLGPGLLAGYLRSTCAETEVRVMDLNIEAWDYLLSIVPEGGNLRQFMQGQGKNFYDMTTYQQETGSWVSVVRCMATLAAEAEHYVNEGAAGPLVEKFLAEQTSRMAGFEPSRVGFTVLFPHQLVFALALARRLRERMCDRWEEDVRIREDEPPRLRVLLGGAALASVEVQELLEACPYVDGVILGEGEPAIAALRHDAPHSMTPGLITRGQGGMVRTSPARRLAIDPMPPADFSDIDLGRYLTPEPVLPMLASRGCRWRRCRFCDHNHSFGAFRGRTPERVVDELECQADRHGVRCFYFADPYGDEFLLQGIASTILSRGLKINFHVMGRP
ncbi:MAG: B12-binding domain-containing radical SAM protein, partial [Planctomycetota bacterium]